MKTSERDISSSAPLTRQSNVQSCVHTGTARPTADQSSPPPLLAPKHHRPEGKGRENQGNPLNRGSIFQIHQREVE